MFGLNRQDLYVLIGMIASSAIGAYISKSVKDNMLSWWYMFVGALCSQLLWIAMVKFYKRPIIVSSMIYDVGTTVFWFMMFVALGEPASMKNVIGVFLAIVGIVLISL